MEPFVDIHCHILPSIDDGPDSWEQSLAMARLAVADGTATIIATPHQLGCYPQNQGEMIQQRTRELQQALDREGIALTVLPGADVRVEPELVAKIHAGAVLTLADGGRYVLLEMPHDLFLSIERLLAELTSAGLIGILSHPERNQAILRQPSLVEPLVAAGCLLQVTAGSLTGAFGRQAQGVAQWLVTRGLTHFVASDGHRPTVRRPMLSKAYRRLIDLVGDSAAQELCCRNPARLVRGEKIAAAIQKSGGGGWFRSRRTA